jgi:hypothetical protein
MLISLHKQATAAPPVRSILLDLDGDGIRITELSRSTMFVDATGDGLLNRTAWAAAGNGVLFYDPDDTGVITEKRQYMFTEWDPTATSDMEARRSSKLRANNAVYIWSYSCA